MANQKLTQLTALAAVDVDDTDLLYIVDDVSGTPDSKKITIEDFVDFTTGTNGAATLASAFTLNAASGTYQDTGLSITLPRAGTYLINVDARGALKGNAGNIFWITVKLYNSTDATDVTDSQTLIVLTGTAGADFQSTAAFGMIVTVAASKVIKLYAKRDTDGSFTTSEISSDANGKTRMRYVKIA